MDRWRKKVYNDKRTAIRGRQRKRYTKTQGQNSKMDKGKHAQRHKERTQRWTKENMHKNTWKELKDGQGKIWTKTQEESSQMEKGKHLQRHKEKAHRWKKKNMHKDTRRKLTDGKRKTCTKTQEESSQMDKGKHLKRHKERTHRWTKENVHENTMTAVRDGQRREREHTRARTPTPIHTHSLSLSLSHTHTHTHTHKHKETCPWVETICQTSSQKIYGIVKKSMVGGDYNARLLKEVGMFYTSAMHSGQSRQCSTQLVRSMQLTKQRLQALTHQAGRT